MPIGASNSVIETIVQRLVTALSPERIYLFGSQARGDAGPDSDYDFLVVVRTSTLPRYRRDQEGLRSPPRRRGVERRAGADSR